MHTHDDTMMTIKSCVAVNRGGEEERSQRVCDEFIFDWSNPSKIFTIIDQLTAYLLLINFFIPPDKHSFPPLRLFSHFLSLSLLDHSKPSRIFIFQFPLWPETFDHNLQLSATLDLGSIE
jgi:hypothetical protein